MLYIKVHNMSFLKATTSNQRPVLSTLALVTSGVKLLSLLPFEALLALFARGGLIEGDDEYRRRLGGGERESEGDLARRGGGDLESTRRRGGGDLESILRRGGGDLESALRGGEREGDRARLGGERESIRPLGGLSYLILLAPAADEGGSSGCRRPGGGGGGGEKLSRRRRGGDTEASIRFRTPPSLGPRGGLVSLRFKAACFLTISFYSPKPGNGLTCNTLPSS
jgi:hypothetical protein